MTRSVVKFSLDFVHHHDYTVFHMAKKSRHKPIQPEIRQQIKQVYQSLDYGALATIYCDEGGEAFWQDRRDPCERLGVNLATVLQDQLESGGRSLYVGAGVAEIPMVIMETQALKREVVACNLRDKEVAVLNHAFHDLSFRFQAIEAQSAPGCFDHIWIVSVLNDPERFPELSNLSYGRANPVTFDLQAFSQERSWVLDLTTACLGKLTRPGLVTTSVEEIPWITHWCEREKKPYVVGTQDYPTALVGDPICFIEAG